MHGRGFWIRPLLVELFAGLATAGLYHWEVELQALRPLVLPPLPALALPGRVLLAQFACHLVLFWIMLVASLIDADDQVIPDTITLPGTLIGLALAAAYPKVLLPVIWWDIPCLGYLHVTSPHPWFEGLRAFPRCESLAIALLCWGLWCFALMPRTWYTRHGYRRALNLMAARLIRSVATRRLLVLAVAGSLLIAILWRLSPGAWSGLITALVGMAAGGVLIWAVRIIGGGVLGREAMGFGDVTLMAMLGTFLGWQSCLMIFFLAPLAGLVIGIFQLVVHRQNALPFGPFLCLAATATLLFWPHFWAYIEPILLDLGIFLPVVITVVLLMIAPLLGMVRLLRRLIF